MKHIPFALTLAAFLFPTCAAGTQDAWSLVVTQGTKQHSVTDPLRLKRAPFEMVFMGPKSMGFAILATTSCPHLERLKTAEQIGAAIRPTNIAAEGAPAENLHLILNSAAEMEADRTSAHVWGDDDQTDMHSFQELKKLPGDQMRSTRTIKELLVELGSGKSQTIPLSKFTGSEICMWVTGLPPMGYMAHVHPKLVRITFQ